MNKFHYEKEELKPKRATFGSAGYDFFAPKDFVVPAHGISETIDSGVSIEMNPGCVLMCYVRSSFGFKHGVTLVNGTGIIDSDYYPNKIMCKLRNDSDEDLVIHKGDKYMQGLLMVYGIEDDEDQSHMGIRDGGLGSTGK